MIEAVRIFVAATPAEWLPMRVLEFSIRETTALPVEVSAIYKFNRAIPMPVAVENRPRTPFSFQRFLIPELCVFSGKAIYMDADMQVFRDIRELWNHDFYGCDLQTVRDAHKGRRGQFSVMLLNCNALGWSIDQIVADLDAGKLDYAALMYEMCVAKKIGRDISPEWNSLERFDPAMTRLLHYTDMNTQPWVSIANPLGHLWITCLRRALQAGFISSKELEREVASGHVRPSLLAQIDSNLDDFLALPLSVCILDKSFVPPYRSLQRGKSRTWSSLRPAVLALLRRTYYRSLLSRFFK
jgi:hypothetical protein